MNDYSVQHHQLSLKSIEENAYHKIIDEQTINFPLNSFCIIFILSSFAAR